LKAAVIQTTSGISMDANLAAMEAILKDCVKAGAKLVVFSELAYLYCPKELWLPTLGRFDALRACFSEWARRYQVYLLPGSVREPEASGRAYNCALGFGPDGNELFRYRKIFPFKARLSDRDYDESTEIAPGNRLATCNIGELSLGTAICYDLRFPEVFRALKSLGAQAVALPAAFTVPTGTAHWDVLTRARAIENQIFVLAAGQVGTMGTGAEAYGHSRIVAPWGEVLGEMGGKEEGFICADLDTALLSQARQRVDCWASRREDLFHLGLRGPELR
jgi:deaminated glutathione amidase